MANGEVPWSIKNRHLNLLNSDGTSWYCFSTGTSVQLWCMLGTAFESILMFSMSVARYYLNLSWVPMVSHLAATSSSTAQSHSQVPTHVISTVLAVLSSWSEYSEMLWFVSGLAFLFCTSPFSSCGIYVLKHVLCVSTVKTCAGRNTSKGDTMLGSFQLHSIACSAYG